MATEIEATSKKEAVESVSDKRNLRKLEDDEEYDYITVPPDGGFGWVVLIACFLINLIIDGFLYAFGAISEDLKIYFQCQEWAVSLVISLACGFYLLSAPVASALCNRWGCRPIGIIGSIIASGAIAASIYSPSIYIMWLLFGFIGGIGMGLVYLPSIVMVGYYFEDKRAIATGIVTAGTGIGSITFGPLSRFLFDLYKWKYGLVILSGIVLLCAACSAFMAPLKPIRKRRISQANELNVDEINFPAKTTSPLRNETKDVDASKSDQKLDSNVADEEKEEMLQKRARLNSTTSAKSRQSINAEDAARPLYKEDVLYQGDTRDLPEYHQYQQDIPTYIQETTKIPETKEKSAMKSFWDVFLSMTNINVLNDRKMIIICLANVCSMIGYYTPYLFIVKVATKEKNIPQTTAVFLLSLIGFTNTASRFVSGWITKIPRMSPLLVNNIGLTVAGVTTLLVPFCQTHVHLMVYCIIWGGFIAFHVSLSPVIVCQIVGLERYSSALGLTLMCRGITSLSAPPIMGAIRDFTDSFNIPFIIGGISFLTSALMHFALMWIIRQEKPNLKQMKDKSLSTLNV
ncbi:unnamed protein product [Rotaria magnacalcarata]|uniref:Uncharacterized protein n=4 Tax=Rotaria magnacalcarata TaxID=392030 RepID=A0A817AH97_9BILA|nr:unnamed protein product [Rotaria magnacalcarata]CAF1612242.1 unnamed protein product [Rotaria magnacalcarata]CAF2261064.1 unnamed protein product [Rotaria magnacalcarata]CAF3853304.1 unnamed protein product [Rotaria magnacalcarata]CAF3981362.1 unnamed protein product [Rotaria magnacalcarata]